MMNEAKKARRKEALLNPNRRNPKAKNPSQDPRVQRRAIMCLIPRSLRNKLRMCDFCACIFPLLL